MNKLWRRKRTWLSYRHWVWCWFGVHDWYYGHFTYPVYNRYERHCLDCDKKQHLDSHREWVTFGDVEESA